MLGRRFLRGLILTAALGAATGHPAGAAPPWVELNDNGAWSWFMDERAVVDHGRLIVGSVRAVKDFRTGRDDPDWGNVEVSVLDLATGKARHAVLHRHFEQDDHDAPAFLVRPDGRYLAVYTRHGVDRSVHYRVFEPGDPLTWGPDQAFESPDTGGKGSGKNTVTYANLFTLPGGRVVNFYRGFGHDPNRMESADGGRTWSYGGRLLRGRGGYSPYLKYAADKSGTVYFVTTDDHPRNFDNSVYAGFVRDGSVYLSDGRRKAPLGPSTATDLAAWDLTPVFRGDADHVAWVIDLELDRLGHPCLVFSVQKDGRGLPKGRGGLDHRYFYGRWDGRAWQVHEVAHAGTRLYPGEDDYTGLAAIDPQDPGTLYISTDADPVQGTPLVSKADGRRHYEIFRGTTRDDGRTWRWVPVTSDSPADNLRPLVPRWDDPRVALVWMRGAYRNNHGEWTTAVVATVAPRP